VQIRPSLFDFIWICPIRSLTTGVLRRIKQQELFQPGATFFKRELYPGQAHIFFIHRSVSKRWNENLSVKEQQTAASHQQFGFAKRRKEQGNADVTQIFGGKRINEGGRQTADRP